MAEETEKPNLEAIDATKSLIEKQISTNNSFEVVNYLSPRLIELKGFNKTVSLVSILDYYSFLRVGQKVENVPGLSDYAKEVDAELKNILKPGTKISLQTMPDSYYYDDKAIRAYNEKEIDVIAYLNNKPIQELLVDKGLAIFNNSESFRLDDVFLSKGEIDRTLSEVLRSSEILAAADKKGFWQDKYSFYEFKSRVIGSLNKTFDGNKTVLNEKVKQINQAKEYRVNSKKTAEERKKERIEQREREQELFARSYSNSSLGEQLSHLAKQYFPRLDSADIVSSIVSGIYPKSAMQIGALWAGIPTAKEEIDDLGAAAHPVEIVEIRKDGDVKPILGQGFLSMVMGNRPPDEGLTLIFTCNTRGIETFIAPLLTQFRMDPIIPIRNIHIARFARPIFSNREFYSRVFGKLPKDITDLVNPDGSYNAKDENAVRELSRLLDYIYLSVPIYIAVKRVQVNNLENNNGSYTITVECQIADVTENYGEFPTYFKTIDDAFLIHQKRAQVIDKINTESAIKHIAEQIGSGNMMNIYTQNKDAIEEAEESVDSKIQAIKERMPTLYDGQDGEEVAKGSKVVGYILRESKLVEVPKTVTLKDATLQAQGKYLQKYTNNIVTKNKVGSFLSYKPAFGNSKAYNLAKRLLGLNDISPSDTNSMKDLARYFSLYREVPSKIPVPVTGNFRIRNNFVYKDDLTINSVTLLAALRTELSGLVDNKYITPTLNPISALFAKTPEGSGFTSYSYNFSNFKKETVIGLGETPIIKPFELCAVTNSVFGEGVMANLMEYEYGIGLGLASVEVKLVGSSNLELKPIEYNYSLIGTLKNINQSLAYFDFSKFGVLPDSQLSKELASKIVSGDTFFGELTSTFGYTIKSNISDNNGNFDKKIENVLGTLGSLKFHCANYKSLTSTKTTSRTLAVGNSVEQRNVITQRYEYWKPERVDHVIGSSLGYPLSFDINIRVNAKIQKVKVGITNIIKSPQGTILFVLQVSDKEKTNLVLRTVQYENKLVHLIKDYIDALPLTSSAEDTTGFAEDSQVQQPTTKLVKKESQDIKYTIRNIIQSIVFKDKRDPLLGASIPNALTNISQILATTKSKNGTKFIDESEPYMFSLMYQLGRVDAGKYTMTFKMRPDRVPYVRPDFLLTDVTTMEMEIFRPEAPKEETRNEAYTRELQKNENVIRRTNTKEGLNTEIGQFTVAAVSELDKTVVSSDITSIEKALRNPVYVVAGMQSVILRYLDYVYSAHVVSKAGQKLFQNDLKITTPPGQEKKTVGLASSDVQKLISGIREELDKKIERLNKKVKTIKDKNPTLENNNKLIEANVRSLRRIVSDVDSRISDARTSNGQPFISIENIKRILRYAQIRNTGEISTDTSSILDELFRIYEKTIDLLLNPTQMSKLYRVKSGEIDISTGNTTLGGDLLGLANRLNALLSITQAIRLASGDSLDFVKRKKLTLKKPIPAIGIVEEYGISSPMKAPGKKKPTYQVIGSTATTAYIQFRTNISELYISETSKLTDLVNEEEGMDAIYNMIREPSEITTVYNMMRSGRALVRDSTVFTQGSNTTFRGAAGTQNIESAFRLVRRASINAAQADSASVLMGLSEPHVQIKEPLLMALGLSKFVAKTTKLSTATDTTSWKVDVFLLPYEAGYTTNRNLKKVNKAVSNETMGDVASWLNAADSLYADRFIGSDGSDLKALINDTTKAQGADYSMEFRRAEGLIRISKMATASVFANLVAVHAMYKAKRKIILGIEAGNLIHPKEFSYGGFAVSGNRKALEDLASITKGRFDNSFSEFDLSPGTFNSSAIYGEIGQTTYIPVGLQRSENTERIREAINDTAITEIGAGIGSFIASRFKSRKIKRVGVGLGKISATMAWVDVGLKIFEAGNLAGDSKLVVSSSDKITESLRNNLNLTIALSQDFSVYALDFIEDFSIAESQGAGQQFIELIAREAETVIQNSGDISSVGVLAYTELKDVANASNYVPTAMGFITSTYPISSVYKAGRPEDYFDGPVDEYGNSSKIERFSIVVVNTNAFGTSGEVNSNLSGNKWRKVFNDFYSSPDNKSSFFGFYTSVLSGSNSSIKKTDIDTCGEELLSLLVDGQIAIYDTDIYSIALAPKYILADPGFYYHGVRSIWGRLKVNHFASHLLSQHALGAFATKIAPFALATSKDKDKSSILKSMEYFGITVNEFSLTKTATYDTLKERTNKLFTNSSKDINTNLIDMEISFPLANGRQIFSKISESIEVFKEIKKIINSDQINSKGSFRERAISNLEITQSTLTDLIKRIYEQSPPNKKSRFKSIPVPFSVRGIDLTDSERLLIPDTYQIPLNNTVDQKISASNKYANETAYKAPSQYILTKIEESLKSQVTWLVDAYSIVLDKTTKSDFSKADGTRDLKEAILTQLSLDRANELGITFEQAKEEYINEMNIYFSSLGQSAQNKTTDEATLEKVQKACDEISLYSTGNRQGREVIFREYTSFVNTFKSLLVQNVNVIASDNIPRSSFSLNKNKVFQGTSVGVSNTRSITGDREIYTISYSDKSKGSCWDVSEKDILESLKLNLEGNILFASSFEKYQNAIANIEAKMQSYKDFKGILTLSYIDVNKREEFEIITDVHRYMNIMHGIERPEYIPSIFYILDFTTANPSKTAVVRTDISLDMLRSYSYGIAKKGMEVAFDFAKYFFIGDNLPFSPGAFLHLAGLALTGLFLVKFGLIAIIIAVLVIVIGIVVMFLSNPTVDNSTITRTFLNSLRIKIPNSSLAVTPLFTGMKALLELAQNISEMDLVPVGIYARAKKTYPKGVMRSSIFVYPPEIGKSVTSSEYLLQDTLSYLTLPLITKRSVNFVTDVLAPGGHVIPNLEKVNENAQMLSSTLLVQESFCRDELDSFPEYLALQKAKANGLGAEKLAGDPLAPTDPANINTGFYQGFISFLDNMEGIFLGGFSKSNSAGKETLTISNTELQSRKAYPGALNELKLLYKALMPYVTSYSKSEEVNVLNKSIGNFTELKKKRPESLELAQQVAASSMSYMFPTENYKTKLISKPPSKFNFKSVLTQQILNIDSGLGSKSLTNEKAYSLLVNTIAFAGEVERIDILDNLSDKNIYPNIAINVKYNEDTLPFAFPLWPDTSAGNIQDGSFYSKSHDKVVKIEGSKRGSSSNAFFNFTKTNIQFIRESYPEGRNTSRIKSDSPNEGITVQLGNNFAFYNLNVPNGKALIFKTKDLEGNRILQDRRQYIFLKGIDKENQFRLNNVGESFLRAVEGIDKQFPQIREKVYMEFNTEKEINSDIFSAGNVRVPTNIKKTELSFFDLYAIKTVYEKTDSDFKGTLTITWNDVLNAIKDIGSYYKFISYVIGQASTIAGAEAENSTIIYDKTNKARIEKILDSTQLVNSNTSSSAQVNTTFAAASGLSTQFVIDRLDKYLDTHSSSIWEATGRLAKEVKNTLMAPVKLYPVAKLYFIRKGKGESVLYDDLFSYADLLSVKIFESQKSPGSVVIIKLANTENKIDNILTGKDNQMSPFEARSRNEEPLSNILTKPGTRLMIYLGHGNILTEEEKFLAEIETSQQEPDGTYTIMARGPGWILNNRLNQSTGPDEANKVFTIDYREVNQAIALGTETDISISEFANPGLPLAKSLLMYGLILKGKLDRFGRLGSTTNELAETSLSFFPPNVYDSYLNLVQKGVATSSDVGSNIEGFVNSKIEGLKTALAGVTYVQGTSDLYLAKAASGDAKLVRSTNISKNIFPNSGFPVSTGLFDNLSIWMRKAPLIAQANGTVWKVVNETYWEFLTEVLLNVPNAKVIVRSYNNDGSLIIAQSDEFYSMYTSKTLSSRLSDKLRTQLLSYKNIKLKDPDPVNLGTVTSTIAAGLTATTLPPGGLNPNQNNADKDNLSVTSLQNIYKSIYKMIGESFTNEAAREGIAQILCGALAGLASGELDDSRLQVILSKLDSGTSINILGSNSIGGSIEVYNQLKSAENIGKLLDELIKYYTNEDLSFTQQSALKDYIKIEGVSVYDVKGVMERTKVFFNAINKMLESGTTRANLEIALDIGWNTKIDLQFIEKATNKAGGNAGLVGEEGGSQDYAFVRRFIYCLTASAARFFNNKLLKLELLAPEKRRIQEQHYMFSGRDIIHNDITTMVGYNEGEFVFEKVSITVGSGTLGGVGADVASNTVGLFTKIERFPFYVDPVSAYEGNSFEYTAKRMFVNLANPTFFAYVMSNAGTSTAVSSSLTLMAANQMTKLIQDWYAGNLYTFGDASRRPGDRVTLSDEIRDMYGPFEIKEVVHSFDVDGFTSDYSPSVFTSVDPRNITDQSGPNNASTLLGVLLAGAGMLGLIKGRKVAAKWLKNIPGVPQTLGKLNNGLTRWAVNGKWGSRLASAISKKLVTPALKNTKFITKSVQNQAQAAAAKTINNIKEQVEVSAKVYAKANGFATIEALKTASVANIDEIIKLGNSLKVNGEPVEKAFLELMDNIELRKLVGREDTPFNTIDEFVSELEKLKLNFGKLDDKFIRCHNIKDIYITQISQFSKFKNEQVISALGEPGTFILDEITKSTSIKGLISTGDNLLLNPGKTAANVNKSLQEIQNVLGSGYLKQTNDDLSALSKAVFEGDFGKFVESSGSVDIARASFAKFYDDFFSPQNLNSPTAKETFLDLDKKVKEIFEHYGPDNVDKAREVIGGLFNSLRSVRTGTVKLNLPGIADFNVTEKVADFFRAEQIALKDLAENSVGKISGRIDGLIADLKSAEFDIVTAPPGVRQQLDSIADARVQKLQEEAQRITELLDKNKTELTKAEELLAKATTGPEKNVLRNNVKAIQQERKAIGKLKSDKAKEIKDIESNKYNVENREAVAESLQLSKELLNNGSSGHKFFTETAQKEITGLMDDVLLARGISVGKGAKYSPGDIDPKSFKTIRQATTGPRLASYTDAVNSPYKGAFGTLVAGISIYSTYALIRDFVGESIQEYMFRLGAKEASDSVIAEFLVYKGEPYLANLEGLTKGSSSLIAPGAGYFDYLASRFNTAGKDLSTILTSIYGDTLKSNLTQYTDLIAKQSISDDFFVPFDSEYKFANRTAEANSASGPGIIGSNPNPFSIFNGDIKFTSGYGWRTLGSDVQFHDGVDIIGNIFTRNEGANAFIEKNAVYATEDSIAFVVAESGFDSYNNALNKSLPYEGSVSVPKSGFIYISLVGLKTGLVFHYRHTFMKLGTQTFSAKTLEENKSPIFVGSGTLLGFHGPFGTTNGPHVHLDIFQHKDGDKNTKFVQLQKETTNLAPGKITSSSLINNFKSLAYGGEKFGYAKVDPYPILKGLGFGGQVKELPTTPVAKITQSINGLTNTPENKKVALQAFKDAGLIK